MKKILLASVLAFLLVGCDNSSSKSTSKIPQECEGLAITGKNFKIIKNSIIMGKNNGKYEPLINQEYKELTGEISYMNLSNGMDVLEECTENGYSFVKLTSEPHLSDSYRGWIKEDSLYKGQILDNPDALTISESIKDTPYTPSQHPDLYKMLGKKFNKINDLRYKAAKYAVESKKCDFAEGSYVDIFNKGTKDNLNFVVDCKNKERISIDEKNINSGGKVKTQLDKSMPQNIAIENCNKLISQKATKYGIVDLHSLLGTNYNVNKTNGNAVVYVDFDIKNKFGAIEKFKARCLFESDTWKGEINIQQRN